MIVALWGEVEVRATLVIIVNRLISLSICSSNPNSNIINSKANNPQCKLIKLSKLMWITNITLKVVEHLTPPILRRPWQKPPNTTIHLINMMEPLNSRSNFSCLSNRKNWVQLTQIWMETQLPSMLNSRLYNNNSFNSNNDVSGVKISWQLSSKCKITYERASRNRRILITSGIPTSQL